MLEECSAPMAAHKTDVKTVLLGREMGGDEGKDVQRNAVYAKEGVPPLPDSCQRGRDILVQSRNVIKSEATKEVSASFLKQLLHIRRRMCCALQLLTQSEGEL